MNRRHAESLINELIAGTISVQDHASLQEVLKIDAEIRQVFRERMDLESGLRNWAAEDVSSKSPLAQARKHSPTRPAIAFALSSAWHSRSWMIPAICAAAMLVVALGWVNWRGFFNGGIANPIAGTESKHLPDEPSSKSEEMKLVGLIQQQDDCVWVTDNFNSSGRFSVGRHVLTKGLAQLQFDSATNLVLEAPCELVVTSLESAKLLRGKVCVQVTEVSNGFTLATPESQIVDEGTEYAVSLDEETAEVHVFDGAVVWIADDDSAEDRIVAGEARRYQRNRPAVAHRIPFGQRQFVRRIEATIADRTGESLLAYDGFENLACQLRSDRSGFGWSGGWRNGNRGRGKLANIVDSPDDEVFGFKRNGRRMLSLQNGEAIGRAFVNSLKADSDESIYVSFLCENSVDDPKVGQSLQFTLVAANSDRNRRGMDNLSFGFSSDGFPYINSGGKIEHTATRFPDNETRFVVVKIPTRDSGLPIVLRVYQSSDEIDQQEPTTWTVAGPISSQKQEFTSIRITAGSHANWEIDELRIGTQWAAMKIQSPNDQPDDSVE